VKNAKRNLMFPLVLAASFCLSPLLAQAVSATRPCVPKPRGWI
jgi:hypothetical protein